MVSDILTAHIGDEDRFVPKGEKAEQRHRSGPGSSGEKKSRQAAANCTQPGAHTFSIRHFFSPPFQSFDFCPASAQNLVDPGKLLCRKRQVFQCAEVIVELFDT